VIQLTVTRFGGEQQIKPLFDIYLPFFGWIFFIFLEQFIEVPYFLQKSIEYNMMLIKERIQFFVVPDLVYPA
jgi:hypothetical protein